MPIIKRLNSKAIVVAPTDSELVSTAHIIQDEGISLNQREKLNFVGAGVTVTDDSGNNATVVTIPGGSGSADFDRLLFNSDGGIIYDSSGVIILKS